MLKWKSNNSPVADRQFTIASVIGGRLFLMPDTKTGKPVEVYIDTSQPAGIMDDNGNPILDDQNNPIG